MQFIKQIQAIVIPLRYRRLPEFGRNDRIRTCDILVPHQVRYQLRHIPMGTGRFLFSVCRIIITNSLPLVKPPRQHSFKKI